MEHPASWLPEYPLFLLLGGEAPAGKALNARFELFCSLFSAGCSLATKEQTLEYEVHAQGGMGEI